MAHQVLGDLSLPPGASPHFPPPLSKLCPQWPLCPGHTHSCFFRTFGCAFPLLECSSHTGHGWVWLIFEVPAELFPFQGDLPWPAYHTHTYTHPTKLFPLRAQCFLPSSISIIQNTNQMKSLGCVQLCNPIDCSLPGSSVHGIFPGKNTGVGCHSLLQGIFPNPGIEPGSPALQADYLPSEPPGKPIIQNTYVFILFIVHFVFHP